ncbi:diguanylate cyclase [Thiolapillus sp.]
MSSPNQTIDQESIQRSAVKLSPVAVGSESDKLMRKNKQYFQDILLRLSFAANGWDEQLDKVLESLQEDLRNASFPDLKRISEKLYRFLMQASANRPAQAEQVGQLLSDFLAHLQLPDQYQKEWEPIVKGSQDARTKIEIANNLEACLQILNQALQETSEKQTTAKSRGLLSSLFKGTSEDSGKNSGDTLAQINEKMYLLLDDLSVPSELEEQVESLKQTLADEPQLQQIPQVIEDITNLIRNIRRVVNQERKGLEDFLGQLMNRLSMIDGALEESNSTNQAIHNCHHKLEEEIQEQTCHIESQAKSATDLNQLKSMVQQRVDAIRNHMEEFQLQEQKLVQAAEEKMEVLVQRLNEVEKETEILRKKVSEHNLQAFNDTLTGIPNRHAYEERLQQEYARWKRYHQPLSIMVVDIDKFKQINDNFGHRAGDKALKIIAGQLQKMTRETDLIARYGGDEFVLLLPETNAKGAMAIAEKLRNAVEQCAFHFRKKKVTITVSCGISEYRKGDTPEDAFERADQALYQSKHKGRNQFTAA